MSAVPSPADLPMLTARELLDKIREHGGRVFRYREPGRVFVLTTNEQLVATLVARGASPHNPRGVTSTDGSYLRAPGGTKEWDLWLGGIPVSDETEHAIWEAAA